jgi:hypothetical protein
MLARLELGVSSGSAVLTAKPTPEEDDDGVSSKAGMLRCSANVGAVGRPEPGHFATAAAASGSTAPPAPAAHVDVRVERTVLLSAEPSLSTDGKRTLNDPARSNSSTALCRSGLVNALMERMNSSRFQTKVASERPALCASSSRSFPWEGR